MYGIQLPSGEGIYLHNPQFISLNPIRISIFLHFKIQIKNANHFDLIRYRSLPWYIWIVSTCRPNLGYALLIWKRMYVWMKYHGYSGFKEPRACPNFHAGADSVSSMLSLALSCLPCPQTFFFQISEPVLSQKICYNQVHLLNAQ